MEFQPHTQSSWSQYFCNRTQMELDVRMDYCLLSNENKHSCLQLEEHPDSHCNVWIDPEPESFKKDHGRSFALDARMRLDGLKSGLNSPNCGLKIKLYKYNSEKDLWDDDDLQSALDLVEILDIDDNTEDEESWLYEPQNKPLFEEKQSALRWCRHVLDNPSPEMEAARRGLMKKLDQKSRYDFRDHAAAFHHCPGKSVSSCGNPTPVSPSLTDSGYLNHNGPNLPNDPITTGYRLQDITDVHIMARIQENSLRQEYVSTPAAALLRSNPEMLPTYLNTKVETNVDFAAGIKTKASYSTDWQPGSASKSPSSHGSSASKQDCQSPKLSRLHQQVTQFKLLRLAQNPGASSDRTRSPLRTSLRSLQAVRNSRSLETDDSGQIAYPPSDVSSTCVESSCGSPLLSGAPLKPNNPTPLMRVTSARITAMRRLQRSHSLSPSRIAHPVKGYLSACGRVFASPERATTAAWGRPAASVQR
nr:SLAIN motif-containing protein-like [Nothobranchius furzeri]